MNKQTISTFLKGLAVGASMMIPGVSGGTMAMILGIYQHLITAVASFRKKMREYALFLLIFGLGGAIGIFLLAKPLSYLTEQYSMFMNFLFMGTVAGSIPMIFREASVTKFQFRYVWYILLGIALIALISFFPDDILGSFGDRGVWRYVILLIAGFVAAVALVLPGISVSYLFLVLGIYEDLVNAISHFDILFLLPVVAGLAVGIIVTTKSLERLMEQHTTFSYLVILGFVLASVAELFPGIPAGMDWLYAVLGFGIGFTAIFLLSKKGGQTQ